MTDRRTVTLTCPRCSEQHTLEFRRFLQANHPWEWWALCPTTGEPILMLDKPLSLVGFVRRYASLIGSKRSA